IPRPPNAFMCFRSKFLQSKKMFPESELPLRQTSVSCSAGQIWRKMNAAERQPYIDMAHAEKRAHALRYPEYRYTP
ncbi:high mobility group box domain-containing protein, partial [Mycena galericulata]